MKHAVGRSRFQRVTLASGSGPLRCVAIVRDLFTYEASAPGTELYALDEGGGARKCVNPTEGVDVLFGWFASNSAKIRALQAAWALHHQEKI